MYTSSSLFQQPFDMKPTTNRSECETVTSCIFKEKPGTGLKNGQFFNAGLFDGTQSEYALERAESLFGSLMHGKAKSIDVKLELPFLREPDDDSNWRRSTTLKKSLQSQDCSDEGFLEASNISSSSSSAAGAESGPQVTGKVIFINFLLTSFFNLLDWLYFMTMLFIICSCLSDQYTRNLSSIFS